MKRNITHDASIPCNSSTLEAHRYDTLSTHQYKQPHIENTPKSDNINTNVKPN